MTNQTFIHNTQTAARKVLQAFGLDPTLFDQFTKNQRMLLTSIITETPRVRVVKGNRVPRPLVNLISYSTQQFLRTNYYGDPAIGLTYLELATYGLTFYTALNSRSSNRSFPPEALKTVDAILKRLNQTTIQQELLPVYHFILKYVYMISKVNFRIYGFNWDVSITNGRTICSTIWLTSEESESISFQYKGKYRKAFRVKTGAMYGNPSRNESVDQWWGLKEGEEPKRYDIFIQSHALQRIRERMDIFPATWRNYYSMMPLRGNYRVVREREHLRPMFECFYEDVVFGYYPFIVQGDKLIILSFLPIFALTTPRGAYLESRMKISRQDIEFLGMDKLSFFFTVDFEQIPTLHEMLYKVGVGPLLEFESPDLLPFERDPQKTLLVKKFFQTEETKETEGSEEEATE